MADDVKLLAVVDANTKAFENALKRIERSTNQTFGKADQSVRKLERTLASSSARFNTIGRSISLALLRPLAALASVQGLGAAVNAFQRIENALKIAGLQGDAVAKVFDHLTETALKNGAPVEALAQLYSKLSLSQKELGISSAEILKFTEGVAAALRLSGRSAEDSRGALLQLSQIMGSAVVRAEEFNSVQEGALPILQAVANGLEEAGGSVSKLRTLVINGQVPTEAFFRAFQLGQGALEDIASTTDLTLSQALTNLQTNLIGAVGRIDNLSSASSTLISVMNRLGPAIGGVVKFIEDLNNQKIPSWFPQFLVNGFQIGGGPPSVQTNPLFSKEIDDIITAKGAVDDLTAAKDKLIKTGKADEAVVLSPEAAKKAAAAALRIQQGFEDAGFGKTVSLKDFKPPAKPGAGGAGAGRAAATSEIDNQKKAVVELIAELQREASLVGASDTQQRISNELHQAGAVATTKQRDAIIALVTQIESQKEAEEKLIDTLDGIRNASGSALDAFSQSIQNSEGAAAGLKAALVDVLQTIIRIGEQQAIASLFGGFGQTGGGLFGNIIGGLFGAATGGGGPALGSLTAASASVTGGGRGAPVIQLSVVPGQMFEPVVERISGNVSIRHAASAETRAVARTPASARDNQRRFAIP